MRFRRCFTYTLFPLAAAAQSLSKYKDALAALADAQAELGESLEEYFSAPPGGAGGVPDPAALLTARAIAQSAAATKSTALSAAAGPLDDVRAAIAESHARYGGITAGVAKRKDALLEFDAYKRKVEALRAAPPKNDPDKLPRNEEKLGAACADLAKANDELITKLVELEKAKPAMVSAHLSTIIAAASAFYDLAGTALGPAAAKAKAGGAAPAPKAAAAGAAAGGAAAVAAAPENPFGDDDEPPVMSFTPSTHVQAAPATAPAHAFPAAPASPPPLTGGGKDPFADEDDGFGAMSSAPPPPPPFPPPAGGAVPGVDDFDNF